MSQEAEETKEKWKRKVQIMFLAPSVKFRCPVLAFRFFEYLIRFWSYQAHDYTVTKCQNRFLQRTLMKAEESGRAYTSLGTRQEGGGFEDVGLSVCASPL